MSINRKLNTFMSVLLGEGFDEPEESSNHYADTSTTFYVAGHDINAIEGAVAAICEAIGCFTYAMGLDDSNYLTFYYNK